MGKHCIVKNIASLRKVNIAHPYGGWLIGPKLFRPKAHPACFILLAMHLRRLWQLLSKCYVWSSPWYHSMSRPYTFAQNRNIENTPNLPYLQIFSDSRIICRKSNLRCWQFRLHSPSQCRRGWFRHLRHWQNIMWKNISKLQGM